MIIFAKNWCKKRRSLLIHSIVSQFLERAKYIHVDKVRRYVDDKLLKCVWIEGWTTAKTHNTMATHTDTFSVITTVITNMHNHLPQKVWHNLYNTDCGVIHYLGLDIAKTSATSIIHSKIDCCNSLYYGLWI